MRRFRRWLRIAVLGTIALGLLLVAGTVVPRPLLPAGGADPATGEATRRILVLYNPIHTDIALQLDETALIAFPFLRSAGLPVDHPRARWVVFGWGGRSFYIETPRWSDLKPMPVLRSFGLDRSVMHVEIAGDLPLDGPRSRSFVVVEADYRSLLAGISASFAREGGDVVLIAGRSYGYADQFFEANGRFNALAGCNTWAASMLRRAGLRTGLWNPLPLSLDLSLSLFNL